MPSITPVAAALLTRYEERQLDYNWYIETQRCQLLSKIKELYRDLVRDRKGEAPKLIFALEQTRACLLIADMKSNRLDCVGTPIYDTLHLEFDI